MRYRFRLFAALTFVCLVPACGSEQGTVEAPQNSPSAIPPAPGGAAPTPPTQNPVGSANPPAPAPAPPNVVEVVVEDPNGDGPVVGAEVQLVDASGKASKAITDAKGSVKLPSASAPYDLSVKHASMPTPYVVLGRREKSVRLPVWTTPSVPASQRTHTFNVAVQVPPCSTTCGLSVLSTSLHGGGQTVESIPTSASWRTMNVTLQHSFYRGGMGASELVTLHAISSNADRTAWGYREVASSGQKGGESTVGMGSLVQVGVRGSLTVNAVLPDATDNLTPSVGAMLVLAGGARLPLFSAQATSGVAIVPDC